MRPSKTNDLYARLGLNRDASLEEIRDAYRKLAFRYHPDRNPNNREEATRDFIAISEAFEILSDPIKRAQYDSTRKFESRISMEGYSDIFTLFNELLKRDFEPGIEILSDGTLIKKEKIQTSYGEVVRISAVKKEAFIYQDGKWIKIENNSSLSEENPIKESKKSTLEKLIEKYSQKREKWPLL
ncbi:J domain-containing protein [Candidatus Woesearchaeota archaeon]|nr:J domain-containing protein [Candidatus Woesearchaeota archaeon]